MKLIYLTAKQFPSKKADPYYVRSMAEAFAELLDGNFVFLVRGNIPQEFKRLNAISLDIPKRFRSFFYFFRLPLEIRKRGWNDRETVFLSYDPNLLAILVFWRTALRLKYRIASDWHQLFDDWKDRYVACGSDYLSTTSKRLKHLLSKKTGVSRERILVAYGGVHVAPYREKEAIGKRVVREGLGLPADAFLVGYVGAFTSIGQGKGLDIMIRALSSVPECWMVFAGGKPSEIAAYRRLAEEAGVAERCIFMGWLTTEQVIEFEIAMDILVIPYPDRPHFRDYGFPMKVWEYLAAGRPIVYSNLAIMGEVLEGRAIPFEPGNERSLADAILTVRKDGEAEKANANQAAVEAYTWTARASHILDFIERQ